VQGPDIAGLECPYQNGALSVCRIR
jgi:hypothetical protein